MTQDMMKVSVLGLEIAFRPGYNMQRLARAVNLVEKRFADQQARFGAGQSRDILLTFLALGLADELLRFEDSRENAQKRLESLLLQIEESG